MENEKKGCVYFIKHVGIEAVKIGYTLNESPNDRFKQFGTFSPYGYEVIGIIRSENPVELEKKIHNKFAEKRLLGEWFDITIEQCNDILSFHNTVEYVNQKNKYIMGLDFEYKILKTKTLLYKKDIKRKVIQLYNQNNNIEKTELAKLAGVSRQTIYDWLNLK
jgi:hypothetical protein